MTDKTEWEKVRESLDLKERITLGQITSYALRVDPKHVLFSLARYKHVAKLLPQEKARVLELGCGEGICTLLLAQAGHTVVGVDSDRMAISAAQELPGDITFISDSFLNNSYGKFDAVVSLDVIEHIPQNLEDIYMDTVCANIEQTGMCVIGTPNVTAYQYGSIGSKIAHINNYSAERLYALVASYFNNVIVLCMNDETLHTGFYPMAHYLLTIGCNKKKK